jgi:hypothetical protein
MSISDAAKVGRRAETVDAPQIVRDATARHQWMIK